MSVAADIGTWLASGGYVGGSTGWTFGAEHRPSTPDKVVCAFGFAGGRPATRPGPDRPGLQIQVRGEEYGFSAADAKIAAIREAIDAVGVWPQTINSTSYRFIRANGSQFSLGLDDNRRPILAANFDVGVSR